MEERIRFTSERYEVGGLRPEDDMLRKHYQETIDTDFKLVLSLKMTKLD